MPCDIDQLPHAGIQSLHPYIPGKSVEALAEEQGLTDIIKLASNENPLGCSPNVMRALSALSGHQIATYPIASNHPLRKKIAAKEGIFPEMIALGNGTDALFPMLQTCFALHTDKHIMLHDYAFISYRIHAQTLGIPVLSIPLTSNWHVDIDGMIAACNEKTALIFIANPNNPTGVLCTPTEIERLLAHIPPTTMLVLDEAYVEYVTPADRTHSIELLSSYPNLIITRTFSKVYGLAGLRLGYTIANTSITSLLQRVLPPFMVNEAALVAAMAALDDEEFLTRTIKGNIEGLKQMIQGLETLGLEYLPSAGNFIFFDCKTNTTPLYEALQRHGIIVRPLHPYGLNNHLRVTVGTKQQNARFLDKMNEVYPLLMKERRS